MQEIDTENLKRWQSFKSCFHKVILYIKFFAFKPFVRGGGGKCFCVCLVNYLFKFNILQSLTFFWEKRSFCESLKLRLLKWQRTGLSGGKVKTIGYPYKRKNHVSSHPTGYIFLSPYIKKLIPREEPLKHEDCEQKQRAEEQ